MKNKLVVWGTNAAEEKVLIALELQADTNKVLLYTFPESIAPEEFVQQMMNTWRTDSGEVPFPEGYTMLERELTVAEGLLPDDLKVERSDLITRAQTEWHFIVLSSKLHKAYVAELEDLKEKIGGLEQYDAKMWETLRGFWDKVQEQARDRNLFREHADSLRDDINVIFDDMKKLRAKVQDEFMEGSRDLFEEFNKKLDEIEKKTAAGGGKVNAVFEELKQIQRRYRESKMSNEHRNKIWNRLDSAFKAVKERKFGPGANEGSLVERHERRLSGLMEAIKRMEDSVRRDEDEMKFQQRKLDVTEGQLEAQIRNAKIKMVEERLVSKREKLAEMSQTRQSVERQIAQAKEKEEKRKKMEAAKESAREEIAKSVKTSTAPPKEEKATGDTKKEAPKEKSESLLDAVSVVLEETMEEVGDTVKAVASVLGEKAEQAIDQAMAKAEAFVDERNKEREERKARETAEKEKTAEPTEDQKPEAEKPAAKAKPKKAEAKPEAEKPAAKKPAAKAKPKKAEAEPDAEKPKAKKAAAKKAKDTDKTDDAE